jgi:hypothetical protein
MGRLFFFKAAKAVIGSEIITSQHRDLSPYRDHPFNPGLSWKIPI